MKLLLTSSGISNQSINNALVELLGKPISESSALIIPTAIYPFVGGGRMALQVINGSAKSPLTNLGWKSLGILELTALPSIEKECWIPTVQETDALLVWGGDPGYLSHWMWQSGLADLLPSLSNEAVYVGVSAGSMAASGEFGETYQDAPAGRANTLSLEEMAFSTPRGDIRRFLVVTQGVGLVRFAIIPHLDNPNHEDASLANAEKWASKLTVPTYAIDDQTAIKVTKNGVEVVSEGNWKLFIP